MAYAVPEIPFRNAGITNGQLPRYAITTRLVRRINVSPPNLPTGTLKLNTHPAAAPTVPALTTDRISMPSFSTVLTLLQHPETVIPVLVVATKQPVSPTPSTVPHVTTAKTALIHLQPSAAVIS